MAELGLKPRCGLAAESMHLTFKIAGQPPSHKTKCGLLRNVPRQTYLRAVKIFKARNYPRYIKGGIPEDNKSR